MVVRKSTPTKDGRKYFFDTSYNDGQKLKRYRSRKYATKREASEAEARFLNTAKVKRKDKITFGQIVDEYISKKAKTWKPSTYATCLKRFEHIKKKLGHIPIESLTLAQYEAFLEYLNTYKWYVQRGSKRLEKRYSAGYKNEIIICLRSLCKYSLNYYGVTSRVPYQIPRYKEPKGVLNYYTEEQFQLFIEHVPSLCYKCLYVFLMYTGSRRGEALALRFSDIDFKARTFTITKTLAQKKKGVPRYDTTPKTQSSVRTLPLSAKAYDSCKTMYDYYCNRRDFSDDYRVFGGRHPLPETTIDRIKNRAISEAGLPHIRIHDLRHSFVSMLISRGADISIIASYVGHSSIKQTLDTYTHMYNTKLENLISQI